MPSFIAAFLESSVALIGGRVVLTCLFWMAGIFGIFNFSVVVQEMRDAALPLPATFAVATIACQLIGSALIITNFAGLGWLGAGALGVFTLLSIPLGHPFWTYAEPRRQQEFQIALEHVTVVGGMLLAAILSLRH
ncbi:DoxX family protein [Ensifer adhaerens]|uniref:DoxX family protein n=1 Tax=Ensifer adhaerens TaxID=106592 RepID=A0A9Q9DF17_ENSAD|nr:DoxX family protein [Ensifer adhaerens]USJ28507.1 DoxX family protein [Ensifer adhaerens]